ncbi:MAG: hypothetical protein LKI25_05625 [Atopobiaceae bacterium]|jgi:hypothetical protein|nr:hypothetical protein [Atopobiaceae bacterium]MCI2173678.1 hypothetical protein [Atopobiaceae bacterium]MCI2207680.1 hypothetical protein [Atopobiaceae bacterium]
MSQIGLSVCGECGILPGTSDALAVLSSILPVIIVVAVVIIVVAVVIRRRNDKK